MMEDQIINFALLAIILIVAVRHKGPFASYQNSMIICLIGCAILLVSVWVCRQSYSLESIAKVLSLESCGFGALCGYLLIVAGFRSAIGRYRMATSDSRSEK